MNLTDRFRAIRDEHGRHRHCCCDKPELEEHLDRIEAEIAEILARIPAPDETPAYITLTAS